MKLKPTRRLFLKGVGGYMLSLPILDVMLNNNGDAYAQGGAIEGNYIYTFQGESSGHPENFYNTATKKWTNDGFRVFAPPTYGDLETAYQSSYRDNTCDGMRKLREMGLFADVNLISNLYIRSNEGGGAGNIHVKGSTNGSPPIMHQSSNYVVNSGYGIPNNRNVSHFYDKDFQSTDQRFYNEIGKKGKHINVAVEKYYDGWPQSTSMRNGRLQAPEKDIGKAFDYLFGGFTPQEGGGQNNNKLTLRRSILDLVVQDHKRLKKNIGYTDRILVDQHLSSIRELEESISELKVEEVNTCAVPGRLSENYPIDSLNYAQDKKRALLLNQMIALAVSCGISRVAQYTILRHKAYVMIKSYIDPALHSIVKKEFERFHGVGHYGTKNSLLCWLSMLDWITGTYGDLINRFKAVPVGDKSLLDYSFIMLGMHQGIGLSLEQNSRNHVHSYENMSYLQAGGQAFGAKTGRHINGNRKHPVSVANKAVELMGHNYTFGDIKDKVDIA